MFESREGCDAWLDNWLEPFLNKTFDLFVKGIGVDSNDIHEFDISGELEYSVILGHILRQ